MGRVQVQRGKKGSGTWLKRWLAAAGLLFAIASASWIIYLDHLIKSRFEGRRWDLPAHVYSAPETLFSGAAISLYQLEQQLRNLGYTKASSLPRPGEFRVMKDRLDFFSRDFYFFDGLRAGKSVRADFSGTSIKKITDRGTGKKLNTFRLEPVLIGGIYPDSNEDRILVRLADTPGIIIRALIASEDRGFFDHHGVSIKGILRAVWFNLTTKGGLQGGSTLTQQLTKNYFLTPERTLARKIREAVMSLLLEFHYSKNEILEAYINEVYLGQDGSRSINGFALSSFFYFSRPLSGLTTGQAATLVALVRGPSVYNPFRFPERAKARRNLILGHLFKNGDIPESVYKAESAAPLHINRRGKHHENMYPAFLTLVREQLKRDYRSEDLKSEGLRIFTTIVPRIQTISEIKLKQQLAKLEKKTGMKSGELQAALIITNPDNGEVASLIGDREPRQDGFNRALNAFRPIGSLIKPVIYLTALKKPGEFNLGTLLSDEPFELRDENGLVWRPKNFDGKSRGKVLLIKGLADSNNIASVRLGMRLTLPEINRTLDELAVEKQMEYPSALLGAIEMSPFQVAELYQHFASGGFSTPVQSVIAVLDRQNRPVRRYPLIVKQIVDEKTVFQLNYALHHAATAGTARSLSRSIPNIKAAGKTGTTDDLRDSWFAGFTGDRLGVVWVGRDNNGPTGLTGASGALRIWTDIMKNISRLGYDPALPENMVMINVEKNGNLTVENCQEAVRVPFRKESLPEKMKGCTKRRSRLLKWIKGVFK